MGNVYGYCRISTPSQNIDRQIRNINHSYPDARIVSEAYTGSTMHRPKWDALMNKILPGDTIVFDSVSRMSRDADTGCKIYMALFAQNVHLVFLKEPHINTQVYRQALEKSVPMTGTAVDGILKAINDYLVVLAQDQIRLAFGQAEKEVNDLRQRTKEGIETAKRKGKQIGQPDGAKLHTKKSVIIKAGILKYSKSFNGTLTDVDCLKLIGCARNTYYKYKRELEIEYQNMDADLTQAEEKKWLEIWDNLHQTTFDDLIINK